MADNHQDLQQYRITRLERRVDELWTSLIGLQRRLEMLEKNDAKQD